MHDLVARAAQGCHVSIEWVEGVIENGPSRVKFLRIPKRNSSKLRTIARPSFELEILQRWLTITLFEKMRIHDLAMAFRPKRSILKNAQRHQGSTYFIRIDFENFFHSIRKEDLLHAIEKSPHLTDLPSDERSMNFINQVCFDKNGRLPIGYISSPVISNIIMYELDVKLASLINEHAVTIGNGVVTRYADDIVFSTDLKGGCKKFLTQFEELLSTWKTPTLKINRGKTIFSSKTGGSAIVTGLRVCRDGHITTTRAYKDNIRLMLSLYAKGKLKKEDFSVLNGHLAYAQNVAPAFFSNLCAKFTNEIALIRQEPISTNKN